MADEQTEAAADEGTAKKGGMLPLILVAVIAAAAGAGGTYFAIGGTASGAAVAAAAEDGAAQAGGEQAEAPEAEAEAPPPDGSEDDLAERMLSLAPFVVNISDEGLTRYLKVKIELELADAEQKPVIEAASARIRDAVIVLLSAKRLADLNQFEGKLLLKEELKDRINALFGGHIVRSVLLTEFVVQ